MLVIIKITIPNNQSLTQNIKRYNLSTTTKWWELHQINQSQTKLLTQSCLENNHRNRRSYASIKRKMIRVKKGTLSLLPLISIWFNKYKHNKMTKVLYLEHLFCTCIYGRFTCALDFIHEAHYYGLDLVQQSFLFQFIGIWKE